MSCVIPNARAEIKAAFKDFNVSLTYLMLGSRKRDAEVVIYCWTVVKRKREGGEVIDLHGRVNDAHLM